MINNLPISYYIANIRLLYVWTRQHLHILSLKSAATKSDQNI